MHGFFVRTAAPADLEAIGSLLAETWHATYDALYGPDEVTQITTAWHSVEALRPRLGRLNSEFLVADDGRELAGVAFAASAGDDAKLVVLHQLYVRPDHQRRGIGSDLLAEIVESFPDATRLNVEVVEANRVAVDFYRRRGFERTRQSAAEIGIGKTLPAIVMEKPLT